MKNVCDPHAMTGEIRKWISYVAEYYRLVERNRNYRLYLFSHMCLHCGDWFAKIAAMISVQRITGGSSTALAIVVMCR